MIIILKTPDDDYQKDIIFKDKNRFESSIKREELDKLDYLFCVDSIHNTRVLCANKRRICLTYKYRNKFKLLKNYKLKTIEKSLKNIELSCIKRKLDYNGNKIDNSYEIERGIFQGFSRYVNLGYDLTNVIVNVKGKNKEYSCCRVFIDSDSI